MLQSARSGRRTAKALPAHRQVSGRPYREVMDTPAKQNLSSSQPKPSPASPRQLTLTRLLPPGEPAGVQEIVAGFGLDGLAAAGHPGRPSRPHVMLNMVSTADGRATLGGRSGPISGPADRELFHGLRMAVDAVIVGAATVRVERYGRIIPDSARRRRRIEQGLSEEPLACIVSGRLALDAEIPLLADPAARGVILTPSAASLAASAAEVHYIRAERGGQLDLPAALTELRERFGVRTLLCEGGPHLNAQLLAAGLVDELFLSLAPVLAGGDPDRNPAHPEALRILAGPELSPPVALELLGALEHDSSLFLRYGVRGSPDQTETPGADT
jgi:riboflavin biosynthesis pyrimidine reductase